MEFISLIGILLIINSLTSKRIITIKARKIVYCANAVKFINKADEAVPKTKSVFYGHPAALRLGRAALF